MRALLDHLPPQFVAICEPGHPLGHTREELHVSNARLGGVTPERFDEHLDRSIAAGLMVELPGGKIATSWIGWAAYRYGYSTCMN